MNVDTNTKKGMSKIGFVLSAIGAAVGLGNIWGFPTKMVNFGGPAFLIPYIIAVLLMGLPFLILEINLGARWRQAPTNFYSNYLGKGGRSFAWMQASVQLLIGTYYAVIISWVLLSIGISFTDYLGQPDFYEKEILGKTLMTKGDSFDGLGKIQPLLFIGFFLTICLSGFIVSSGVEGGIERLNKIVVPFLFVLIAGIFFYSFTLKGSDKGLDFIFKPDISKLKGLDAWKAAFSQATFTLSLAVSVIIVYSIHAPKDGDNTNRALTIMSGDTLIAILACVIIGSTLGYAETNGLVTFENGQVIKDGKSLSGGAFVFKVFPIAFKSMNEGIGKGLGNTVAFCFYLAIFFAAISSMISLLEPAVTNLEGSHGIKRAHGVLFICLVQFVCGIIFTFQGGEALVDVVDGQYTGLLLLPSLIVMGIMCVWNKRKFQDLVDLNNRHSRYKLGGWYRYLVIVSILLATFVLVAGLVQGVDGMKKINGFQWGLTAFFYFVPFCIFVFGYGFNNFWANVCKKKRKFAQAKEKE